MSGLGSPPSSPPLLPMEYSLGNLAPADFADLNAGAGPTSELSRFTTTVGGARSLQQRFMSEIQGSATDERDWIRIWRRKIKETITRFNDTYYDFLIKKEGDPEVIQKARQVITRISSGIPSSSRNYFPELGWDISMNDIVENIEADLSLNLLDVKESQKKIIRSYSDTLKELMTLDGQLQEKINKVNQTVDKLQALMTLDTNSETGPLSEAMSSYVSALLKKNDIALDFIHFTAIYKKWLTLYDILQLQRTVSATTLPLCCICATNDVTHAMIPCGHTFCSGCINKQMAICYICRTSIRDRLKLHFP